MANQYCKITSWIEHNKKHGDEKYAKAISDLCLESSLNPTKYNGLTFLYQTDKKIREKFSKNKFSIAARIICNEFKRHILPDVFLSCEDFQTKEVGNILGKKYKVESCTKDTVTFKNGMKIKAVENSGENSFEPLSENLKDIIKIYYIVEGDPNNEEVGDYKINHRKRPKKNKLAAQGGSRLIRGGTPEEFEDVYLRSGLGDIIKNLRINDIRDRGASALHIGLLFINSKLEPVQSAPEEPVSTQSASVSENTSTQSPPVSDNILSQDIFSDSPTPDNTSESPNEAMLQSPSNNLPESTYNNSMEGENKQTTTGGNELGIDNLKNLILMQWLVNSSPEGIITYIYLCLFVLYKSEQANEAFKLFVNELITKMFGFLTGQASDIAVTEDYISQLTQISASLGFSISEITEHTKDKISYFMSELQKTAAPKDFTEQFFNRISNFKTIWGGEFVPAFFGDMDKIIPIYGTYLGLWTLTIFSSSLEDVDYSARLTMLDNAFCKIIRNSNTDELKDEDTQFIFSEETLNKFLNKVNTNESPIIEEVRTSLELATQTKEQESSSSSAATNSIFD